MPATSRRWPIRKSSMRFERSSSSPKSSNLGPGKRRTEHGGAIGRYVHALKMETNGVVERIRSLLARFSEDEATVRRLVATDARFDALCQEYRTVIELLDAFEAEVERLTALEAEVKRLRKR